MNRQTEVWEWSESEVSRALAMKLADITDEGIAIAARLAPGSDLVGLWMGA